jgi:hypothetical protein
MTAVGTTWATWAGGEAWGRRGTWDRELVLLETLHPQAVEIAKGGNNVVGVTTLPPPTLRRGGKGWDSAAGAALMSRNSYRRQ